MLHRMPKLMKKPSDAIQASEYLFFMFAQQPLPPPPPPPSSDPNTPFSVAPTEPYAIGHGHGYGWVLVRCPLPMLCSRPM